VGSKGSYVQLASGANLAQDVYGIFLWFNGGNTSATIRDILADIGVDPAGGTAYAQLNGINNIFVPQAVNACYGGRMFWFPLFVKAGSSIGVCGQSNIATTFRCMARFYGRPTKPENEIVGRYTETIGVSGNGGTPFTCGSSGAVGDWTSIGTTTRPLWYFQLCAGHNVSTVSQQISFFDLGFGDGTVANTIIIIKNLVQWDPDNYEQSGNPLSCDGFWEVPAGSTLYVRGSSSTTAQGTEAVAVGIGG
jgi:hypothetical protein